MSSGTTGLLLSRGSVTTTRDQKRSALSSWLPQGAMSGMRSIRVRTAKADAPEHQRSR